MTNPLLPWALVLGLSLLTNIGQYVLVQQCLKLMQDMQKLMELLAGDGEEEDGAVEAQLARKDRDDQSRPG